MEEAIVEGSHLAFEHARAKMFSGWRIEAAQRMVSGCSIVRFAQRCAPAGATCTRLLRTAETSRSRGSAITISTSPRSATISTSGFQAINCSSEKVTLSS